MSDYTSRQDETEAARLWDSERRDSPYSTVADVEDEFCDACGDAHSCETCREADRLTDSFGPPPITTYIFDRDPELGAEPLGYFEKDGLIYVTTTELDAGVEPIGVVSYPCGCDATVSCERCV